MILLDFAMRLTIVQQIIIVQRSFPTLASGACWAYASTDYRARTVNRLSG